MTGTGQSGISGQTAELTRSENKILGLLADNRGKIVEREQLMEYLWSTDEYVTDASLTVLVSRLRAKISAFARGFPASIQRKERGITSE